MRFKIKRRVKTAAAILAVFTIAFLLAGAIKSYPKVSLHNLTDTINL